MSEKKSLLDENKFLAQISVCTEYENDLNAWKHANAKIGTMLAKELDDRCIDCKHMKVKSFVDKVPSSPDKRITAEVTCGRVIGEQCPIVASTYSKKILKEFEESITSKSDLFQKQYQGTWYPEDGVQSVNLDKIRGLEASCFILDEVNDEVEPEPTFEEEYADNEWAGSFS